MVSTLGAANDPANDPAKLDGSRIRRRPKDRKAQITRAAAEAFSVQGYHATSMEAIAAKVGISAPALYRHYPSKYEMFAVVVGSLGQQLVDGTAFIDEVSGAEVQRDPAAVLDRAVGALITVAIRNREAGGLYRWQGRYLQAEDRDELAARIRVVNRRLQRPLIALRPELTSPERWTLSAGLLSIAGSIIGHRPQLPDDEIRPLLIAAARALAATRLPQPADIGVYRPAVWRIFAPDAGPYEALLHAAILLFGRQGYTETSVNEIADAVDMPTSGVYRYFSSKSDVLATGLQRAMDRLGGEMSAIVGAFADPAEALIRLVEAYVATVFANPELAAVYDTERVNLGTAEREMLRESERVFIDNWVKPMLVIRPELDVVRAKFLVHAVGALVDDLARLAREGQVGANGVEQDTARYAQARLRKLLESIVLGGGGVATGA